MGPFASTTAAAMTEGIKNMNFNFFFQIM